MNKYKYILLASALFLAAHNGLMLAEQSEKPCMDANKHTIKAIVTNYILAYVALYSAIPVISASAISMLGSAPLKNSFNAFMATNGNLGKLVFKTMPITAPLALAYNSVKKNLSE